MAGGGVMLAAAGPSPLWYLSRGTGAITLVLLSMTVVLGITGTLRWRPGARTPRFVVDGLHRNISLLVVVLLCAHVVTALLDPFAHLRVLDAVVPLASSYRPLWLGFGALALDLLIALTVTSLLRARLGLRAWRAVHWAAYACWPVAVLHGLGTGTDARSVWLQTLTAVCVGGVVVALGARLLRDWPARAGLRVGGLGVVGAALVGTIAFAVQGPLAQGWARRAGTPATLLAASRTPVGPRPAAPTFRVPFAGSLSGTATQRRSSGDGSTVLDIAAQIRTAGAPVNLDLRLFGRPLPGGGLQMSSSSVTLGPAGQRGLYRGRVVALSGDRVEARLATRAGRAVLLRLVLRIDASRAVAGTAAAQEIGG
jgi:methionine sulfoxide reductase heme-binding subunit